MRSGPLVESTTMLTGRPTIRQAKRAIALPKCSKTLWKCQKLFSCYAVA